MASPSVNGARVLLWETPSGLRCTLDRRASESPYQITIQRGAVIVKQVDFQHDWDAADFAIAAMREGDNFDAAAAS